MPVLFFSHSNPMDEVRGGKMFWRKSNSRFRGVRTRNLGSYKDSKLPAGPQLGPQGSRPLQLAHRYKTRWNLGSYKL